MNLEIYKPGTEYWFNAKIPRGTALWTLLSDGYKMAADILVKHVEDTHSNQDYLVHPINFLLRHSIELYLKQIIYFGTELLSHSERQPKGHNVLNLWKEARIILEERWPDGDRNVLEKHEKVLSEINAMDPSSQTFRYHIDSKLKSYLLPDGCTLISIKNMAIIISETGEFLENCAYGLQCELDEVMSNYEYITE